MRRSAFSFTGKELALDLGKTRQVVIGLDGVENALVAHCKAKQTKAGCHIYPMITHKYFWASGVTIRLSAKSGSNEYLSLP